MRYKSCRSGINLTSGEIIELIKEKIGVGVFEFLERALQLDEDYLQLELKAEKIGAFQD